MQNNIQMTALKKLNLFIITFSMLTFISCKKADFMTCINGEGDITTQVLELSSFDKIDLAGSSNVTISQGTTQKIKVIGHSNIIDKLKTSVSSNLWTIKFEEGCYKDDLAIEITVPNLESVEVSGSGNVLINNFSNQSSLRNVINGSGKITLNEFEGITSLTTILTGSGSFEANNNITTLNDLNLNISGSGRYHGFEISSNNATVNLSGSGKGEVTVINNLNVKVNGSGSLYYKGTSSINQSITGSGSLINAN